MSPWRRRLALLLATLALALGVWWALRPAPVPVETGEVTRGPLQLTVDEEGETRVRQRFVVAAPATGRLLRITLDEGDAVAAGDLLAQVVPAPETVSRLFVLLLPPKSMPMRIVIVAIYHIRPGRRVANTSPTQHGTPRTARAWGLPLDLRQIF